MLKWLNNLDRRWIFLLMFLAVALPILLQLHVPETTTELSQAVFNEIEKLKPGDKNPSLVRLRPRQRGRTRSDGDVVRPSVL